SGRARRRMPPSGATDDGRAALRRNWDHITSSALPTYDTPLTVTAEHSLPSRLRAAADACVAALAGGAPTACAPQIDRSGDTLSSAAVQAAHAVATHPRRRRRRGYPGHERGSRLRRNIAMATGIVTWFNSDKGYGFIAPEDGSADVFAHFSAIVGTGRRDLVENQRVEFETEQGPKGMQAVNIRGI